MNTCGTDIVRVRKEATGAFNCDACGKIFTKKAYLSQHKRTHAVRKTLKEFDCKLCEKVYASNQKLGKHVQKAHPNPRRVEDANVGFMVFEYPMHSVTVNQKKKILKCKQCNYESGRKLNLKRHIESHTANWSAKETTRRTIFCHKKIVYVDIYIGMRMFCFDPTSGPPRYIRGCLF